MARCGGGGSRRRNKETAVRVPDPEGRRGSRPPVDDSRSLWAGPRFHRERQEEPGLTALGPAQGSTWNVGARSADTAFGPAQGPCSKVGARPGRQNLRWSELTHAASGARRNGRRAAPVFHVERRRALDGRQSSGPVRDSSCSVRAPGATQPLADTAFEPLQVAPGTSGTPRRHRPWPARRSGPAPRVTVTSG